jgi:hypothetical protein
LWDGTTLTKSPYDPVHLLKTYTDEKTKFVKAYRGVNIADLSDITVDRYVAFDTGLLGVNSTFVATGFYEIIGGIEYQVSSNYDQQFAFYDVNKVYISGLVSANINHKFTTPSNARYVRFSVAKIQLSEFMVAKASEFPLFFTPYQVKFNDISVEPSQVNNFCCVDNIYSLNAQIISNIFKQVINL